MSSQVWRVVGGGEAGGLLVREGRELTSAQLPSRLSMGALVEELALRGERLQYRKMEGSGPDCGWVSVKAKGSMLLVRADAQALEAPGAGASAGTEHACDACGERSAAGRPGDGLYSSSWYCDRCWSTWEPGALRDVPLLPARKVPGVQLPGGGKMPLSGLGLQDGRASVRGQLARANVYEFLMLGGRHLDAAVQYHNNQWVGEGMAAAIQAGVPREEIFLSVKVGTGWFGSVSAMFKFPGLLKELGVTYIDLLMIHYPFEPGPDDPPQKQVHQDTWKILERFKNAGQVGDLGVSNFGIQQMEELMELNIAPIAVNQLEYSPWIPSRHRDVVEWCHERGIAVSGYCSAEPVVLLTSTERLGFPRVTTRSAFADMPGTPATDFGPDWLWQNVDAEKWSFERPTVAHFGQDWERILQICNLHGKTLIQVILRWTVQHTVCVVPGSANHMVENLNIFDWTLSEEEMAFLDSTPGGLTSYRTPFGPETLR
mmetsp:Transcript_23450/g.66929  ORF Transcript_23450/g.66929 Transcript_23450/m.66929 type:complete len:486 (+) Transcript_23450:112-1569(+)